MNRVLVVAAHPDDEILGVGATAAIHTAKGDEVYCLILGEGQTSRGNDNSSDLELINELHNCSIKSGKIIGYKNISFANFPDNCFDSCTMLEITKRVEKEVELLRPSVIYTHCEKDLNIDHQYAARAVLTATRPVADCPVKAVLSFETLSSTEWNFGKNTFIPNVFVGAEKYFIEKKIEAMKCYKSELREYPHPRSAEAIMALAMLRGGTSGHEYAEAFELMRYTGGIDIFD